MQRDYLATQHRWLGQAMMAKDKTKYWAEWQRRYNLPSDRINQFGFLPEASAVSHLPSLSYILRIPFQLQKPYLSRDERDFQLLDNPVRREKVFQVPMVAATSWKGALRAALWQMGYNEENEITNRLLGNPRGSEEGQAARLYFYPTFFSEVGLEVINPHSRETGVGGRGPILLECVPKGSGLLVLLYAPFGTIEETDRDRLAAVAQDLEVLARAVQAMLTVYGFGAKTMSGFGTAYDVLAGEGTLAIRADLPKATQAAPVALDAVQSDPGLARYLESPTLLHADFRRADGSLKLEEEYRALIQSRGQKYAKSDKLLYGKAKGWWERDGRELAGSAAQEPKPDSEPAEIKNPPVSTYAFHTLTNLCELAQRVAALLRDGGEA